MFFQNLRIGFKAIESIVKDKLIIIDEGRLKDILEMPRFGICFLDLKKKIDGRKVILERDDLNDLRNFIST